MLFTVGFKLRGKSDHVVADAQDALDAALKVKTERPEAVIMYVRPQNSAWRYTSPITCACRRHPLMRSVGRTMAVSTCVVFNHAAGTKV